MVLVTKPVADGQVLVVDAPRRTRRSRAELHKIVLDAGRDLLLSEGLGTGAEHLSFKRVLSHVADTRGIRITNASIIGRVWQNQEEFQTDVIRSIVDQQVEEEVQETSDALVAAMGRLDVSTPELRRASLGELIRVTSAQYLSSASTSTATIQMALVTYVAASESRHDDNPLVESFRATNERSTQQYIDLYQAGLDAVGWRVRSGLSLRDAAVAFSAFAEGTLMRQIVEPDAFVPIVQISLLDGSDVEWTLLGLGMNSLVDFFAEPDPDWQA